MSDLRIRENAAKTFSVIARSGAFTQTEYAQTVGPRILAKLEEYFNYKYTNNMEKMEMVALPDFNFQGNRIKILTSLSDHYRISEFDYK